MDLRFGLEVRRLREEAGLSQTQLARKVPISQSQVSAIERGAKGTTASQAMRLDTLLNAGGKLVRRWEDSQRKARRYADWFAGIAVTERESAEIREYCPLIVSGLLQTKAYSRVVFRQGRPLDTEEEIEERVKARMERQEVLYRDRPPLLRVIIEEHVLYRPIGGKDVMAAQLDHLRAMAERPHVQILIVPMESETCPGQDGGFLLFTVPKKGVLAFTETKVSGHPSDHPDIVSSYQTVFSDLAAVALPPSASLRLIRENLNHDQQ
ncbi:helix-turn-helix transcriptional regulator [Streptomonospora arabica]|uniref:Helix-turn-helix transcriptional regulator n=1 Tax=Streptomonospora arabica TaxID=412417 RepID=A0ABV9SPL6_9ACTN